MLKKYALALFNVLCIALIVASAMAVSAVGEQGGVSSQEGSSSSSSSVLSNAGSSSDNSKVSSTESSSTDSTNSAASSSSESSSDISSSSSKDSSSDENSSTNTSSGNTSSKKPIHSTGDHGNTFIDQDFTSGTESTTTNVSTPDASLISSDYNEGIDIEIDNFVGRTNSAANQIYKIIWIPIVMAVICVGALVTVNILFRKKYPKAQSNAAARRDTSWHGAKRRKPKK